MRPLAGLVRFDGAPADPSAVRRMLDALAVDPSARTGAWHKGSAAFGSVIRQFLVEDQFDAQPLPTSARGGILVPDAMLNNRAKLASAFGWS